MDEGIKKVVDDHPALIGLKSRSMIREIRKAATKTATNILKDLAKQAKKAGHTDATHNMVRGIWYDGGKMRGRMWTTEKPKEISQKEFEIVPDGLFLWANYPIDLNSGTK